MEYTNQENIEAYLKRDLTGDELVLLPLIATSVESWINQEVGSIFTDPTETTRYYDGGSRILDLDPVRDITAIAIVDREETVVQTYELNEDFEIRPRNDTIKAWVQKRWGCFPRGVGNIAVTGKFTLSPDDNVPKDIQYLATYMMAQSMGKVLTGELKKESIEGYSREWRDFVVNDQLVQSIINKYNSEVLI